MDNFGDYIYLILIVIAAIGGLFGKKKKTEQAKQAAPTEAKPTWEDLMRQLQENEEEEQTAEPEPIIKPVATEQPAETIPTPVQKTSPVKESVEDIAETDEWNLDTPEAARKAFVYSEIFNRKYVEMK